MAREEHELEQEIRDAESWLAGWETPLPSAAGVAATKAAVRAALRSRQAARLVRRRWWSGLATAAAVVLAAGLGWHYLNPDRVTNHALMADAEADLQPWPPETSEDATYMVNLSTDLAELESWSADDAWDLDGVKLYRALEDAVRSGESVGETESEPPSSYRHPPTAPRIEEA